LKLMPYLNERQLRIAAALEARSLGRGGILAVAQASGIARGTIYQALKEIGSPKRRLSIHRIRSIGGGRKRIVAQDPAILKRLRILVESNTRGDPMTPLLWTGKSTGELAEALSREGHQISPDAVGRLLKEIGY